ncbi:MAG: tRNA (adenosine(37)-N6)-dimethylallyltransferase MiaA [Actinobacteria bacterium]|nr:tRNA (adenosine(37)-N6)-dimethylallyltransferase MiaA [Actinomycetota bacterium]
MSLIFIVGATATGKSDLSIQLAKKLQAEIINADSMQLYRGMDIGTAKLSLEQREGIPHHLVDVLDVTQDASVAEYQGWARAKIDSLIKQGKNVVVVGGTGLYIKAILDELNFPDTDPVVRARLSIEAQQVGIDEMHARLAKLDPAAAAAIPKENARRVVRALEVIEITGAPFTANLPKAGASYYPDAKQFGVVLQRDDLKERIDRRVDAMWESGFVEEVRSLIDKGITSAKTARAALGYNQIITFLEGAVSEEEAREETKRATRAYARRQETWFSRDERITWLKGGTSERLDAITSSTIG